MLHALTHFFTFTHWRGRTRARARDGGRASNIARSRSLLLRPAPPSLGSPPLYPPCRSHPPRARNYLKKGGGFVGKGRFRPRWARSVRLRVGVRCRHSLRPQRAGPLAWLAVTSPPPALFRGPAAQPRAVKACCLPVKACCLLRSRWLRATPCAIQRSGPRAA